MTVTDTLATKKALTRAGVPDAQAETMANLDEQHAADAAEYIRSILESTIERTTRDQARWMVGFVSAAAAITIAIVAILTR